MNENKDHKLSRREFAHRAALLSATASLVPAGVMLPADAFPNATASAHSADLPKLSVESQAEADARFQMVLGRYGNRLNEEEKQRTKGLCYSLQTTLEQLRSYSIKNGDVPALFLKPLIDRDNKPKPTPATTPAPSANKS
ncbi:MAG TPA: hypothetical protein VGF61_01120 [Candidatus Acidoferrum sp.]|jgi:hypothetical protein